MQPPLPLLGRRFELAKPHDQSQVTTLGTKVEENEQLGGGDQLLVLPPDRLPLSKNECLALPSALELSHRVSDR